MILGRLIWIHMMVMVEVIAIRYKAPGICPVCDHELHVNKLTCNYCNTKLEGEFTTCKFCKLPDEQLEFIEVFIKCRGNIKDVEKELGISYPTVRSRLDGVIQVLGYRVDKSEDSYEEKVSKLSLEYTKQRHDVLDQLEKGEITAQEAAEELRRIKK